MPEFRRSWLRWKLHRVALKHIRTWRRWQVPDGSGTLHLRYLGEGKVHYVFRVKELGRLLRITRAQFYHPDRVLDAATSVRTCELMNDLAEHRISVACRHLGGGACLVDDAGQLLSGAHVTALDCIDPIFTAIVDWSLKRGTVLLDYNEGNWCVDQGVVRLVDIDVNFTCLLADIRRNEIVRKRIDTEVADSDESALRAFVEAERRLLWATLASQKT